MRVWWCLVPASLLGACSDDPWVPADPYAAHETSSSSGELECGVAATYTLEEADTLHITPRCDFGPTRFEGLPEGATVNPEGRLTWVPRLDQAGPFSFDLVDAGGSHTKVTGWVLDRFDAPGNLPLVNRLHYTQEHGLPVVHLRWHSDDRLALTQSFDDNSQLRTRLGFETWNRSSDENLDLDHASVVVFVEDEYQGLYTLTDRIGDHLLEQRGLDKNGQLFESRMTFPRSTRSCTG